MYSTSLSSYVDFIDLDLLVEALLAVVFLLREVVFFPAAVFVDLAVLDAWDAFFVFPRFVAVAVFFPVVDVRPLADGDCNASPASSVVIAFLRVPRRVVAPSCRGLSSAFRCTVMNS